MATQTNLSVVELDFDGLKANFRRFVQNSGKFTDFNFDGSGISHLIDLLAYNSTITGTYVNFLANEMFLDSAVRRDSVVSLAKSLGYTPSSTRASKATLSLTFSGITAGTTATLAKFTQFAADKDGDRYTFVTVEATEIDTTEDTAVIESLDVYEGEVRTRSFVFDENVTNQRFTIPDAEVDTQFLEVTVQAGTDDTTGIEDEWTLPPDYAFLDGESQVYFLQEGIGGKFEIYFGDGVLGQALSEGNVVTIRYIVTSGILANDIGTMETTGDPVFSLASGGFSAIATVVNPSAGGAPREDTAAIKQRATRYWQSQDRAVTTTDYEVLVLRDYPYAESVFVWGGEDNSPPEYGKVFISIKPRSGSVIGTPEKTYIKNNILKKRNVVTVTPEIVDPDYLYVLADVAVLYDQSLTKMTGNDVINLAKLAIVAYDAVNLEKFDSDLRFSKFVAAIDSVSPAIISNNARLTMQKRLKAIPGRILTYEVKFNNKIHSDADSVTVSSDTFQYKNAANEVVTAFIEDDGEGNLQIVSNDGGVRTVLNATAGTVDYEEGIISLTNFAPVSLNDTFLKINALPEPASDIVGLRNNLTKIDFSDAAAVVVKAFTNKAELARSANAPLSR